MKKRVVPGPTARSNQPLLTATKDELVERVHKIFGPIQSFRLRADIAPSVGALYGGELTDYATIRALILFHRPDNIRIVGLDPVVHSSTIFDMVSVGREFRVSIPSKSRFIEGDNDAPPSSKNKLENLRPTAFLTSMLIDPPAKSDLTLLEDETDESKAIYILIIAREENGQMRAVRNLYFDREKLDIVRQKTFTPAGAVMSETRYASWKEYGDTRYPESIIIRRPVDGYEVTLTTIEMHMNPGDVSESKFKLEQPAGSTLQILK